MRIDVFRKKADEIAGQSLPERARPLLVGNLPDRSLLAVYAGAVAGKPSLLAVKKSGGGIIASDLVATGSHAVTHPSVDTRFGTECGPDGHMRGTRGPWSVDFPDIGRVVFSAEKSNQPPQLITQVPVEHSDGMHNNVPPVMQFVRVPIRPHVLSTLVMPHEVAVQ